jgi:hypothetical protein
VPPPADTVDEGGKLIVNCDAVASGGLFDRLSAAQRRSSGEDFPATSQGRLDESPLSPVTRGFAQKLAVDALNSVSQNHGA